MLAVAATCLVAALVGAPTAGAASAGNATAKSAQKAKAAVTKKALARSIAAVRRRANTNRRNINRLRTSLTTLETSLRAAITGGDKTIDDKINGIVAAVTPILTQIGGGLQELATKTTDGFNQVTVALNQLKTGLETAGAAIQTVATSQEYGVTGVFAGTTRIVTFGSADIPDDGNSVLAGGTLPVVAGTGAGGTLPGGTPLAIRSAIRSGEAGDGDPSGDEAGQVGGLLSLRCAAADGACDLDPTAGNSPVASGAVVCTVGPPSGGNYPYDPPGDAAPTTLPLVGIQEAADRTDQAHPDATVDATDVNPVASGAATGTGNAGNGSCSIGDGTGNDVYELVVQTQFVDLPTSESPGADD